jgi:hypothetical protein
MASYNFTDWNWASEHVQVDLKNGEYVSAESTLMLAGPSRLSMALSGDEASMGQYLVPIGLIQMFQIAQNRQVARLFEIGSKRSYFVPGRLFSNFQMNRILFFGPSLMRLLYAVAPIGQGQGQVLKQTEAGKVPLEGSGTVQTPSAYKDLFPERVTKSGSGYLLAPGYGNTKPDADNRDFYINLASEVFNVPFGVCMVTKDAKQRPYGAFYLEDMMIEAHTMGVDSNNIVIAEGCNGQFDMVVPLTLQAPAR